MSSSIPRPGLDTYFLFPAVSPTLGLLGVGVGQCTSTRPSHIQPRTYVSIATLSPKISWEFRTAATGGAGQTAPPVGWPWVWGKGPGSQMQLEAGPQPHSRGSDHPGCFSSLLTGPYPPGSPLQKQGSLSPVGSPCSQPLGSPLPQDEVSPPSPTVTPLYCLAPHTRLRFCCKLGLLLESWYPFRECAGSLGNAFLIPPLFPTAVKWHSGPPEDTWLFSETFLGVTRWDATGI